MSENLKADYKNLSYLSALCMFLSAVEYAFPKPLPFIRLGLANLPILIGIKIFNFKDVFVLVLIKILLQSFISGTLFSYIFIFSATGSISSVIGMFLVYRLFNKTDKISNIGICLCGSLFNNIAQLLVSYLLIFKNNTKYIAPLLLVSGIFSSFFLGIFSNYFEKKSEWLKVFFKKKNNKLIIYKEKANKTDSFILVKFIISMILMCLLFFQKNILFEWLIIFLAFLFLEITKKGKVKILNSIILMFFIILFSLMQPCGKIIFNLGSFYITQQAIKNGLIKSGMLIGMVFLSKLAIDEKIQFRGKLGFFINEVFCYFEELTSVKIKFNKKNIFEQIDNRLLLIWNT